MTTMSSSDKAIEVPHDDNGDDDDDDDTIDEEQLEEYEELVQELGGFPVSATKEETRKRKCLETHTVGGRQHSTLNHVCVVLNLLVVSMLFPFLCFP